LLAVVCESIAAACTGHRNHGKLKVHIEGFTLKGTRC